MFQPSFLETLKRSSKNLSAESLDDFRIGGSQLLSENSTRTSPTTAPTLPFTLDLSPIMEDLHVFENISPGPGLPGLQGLTSPNANHSDSKKTHSSLIEGHDVFGAQLFVKEAQEGKEGESVVMYMRLTLSIKADCLTVVSAG